MDAVGEAAENAIEDPDDFLVVAEHPNFGHVNRSKNTHLVEEGIDEHTLDCIKIEVEGEVVALRVVFLCNEKVLVDRLANLNRDTY